MKVVVGGRWWLALASFVAATAVLEVSAPAAALVCSLLPAAKLELALGWKLAIAVALGAAAAKRAAEDHVATILGKAFRDFCRSRLGMAAYGWFGGVLSFADVEELRPVPSHPGGDFAQVFRTARHTGERLTALAPLLFGALTAERLAYVPMSGAPTVVLDASVHFQTHLGFGGSFTESSAELLQRMSPGAQEKVMNAYFSEGTGLGFRLGRFHMGSCDFSRGNWTCVRQAGDVELETFNIDRYEEAIIPMIRRANEVAGTPMMLLASPWSPPPWMKDTGTMMTGGKLLPEMRGPWAKHFARFAQEFRKQGLPLWGFTVQNEPQASTPWENCLYSAEEERDFVRDHLGPALERSGEDVKLIVWDHNRDDMFIRAHTIYGDPAAAKHVWGMAYHWYGDPRHEVWPAREGQVLFDNLRHVHDLRPDKHIIMSEACQEFGPRIGDWSVGERYGEAILRDLNNWLEAWIDWNLILDTTGGPNHVSNLVSAPVIADLARDRVLFLPSFYYLGHFARFIRPGARRIAAASNRDALEVTAFENVDGTVAAVVMNRGDTSIPFYLQSKGKAAQAEAPPHSISTFVLRGHGGGRR